MAVNPTYSVGDYPTNHHPMAALPLANHHRPYTAPGVVDGHLPIPRHHPEPKPLGGQSGPEPFPPGLPAPLLATGPTLPARYRSPNPELPTHAPKRQHSGRKGRAAAGEVRSLPAGFESRLRLVLILGTRSGPTKLPGRAASPSTPTHAPRTNAMTAVVGTPPGAFPFVGCLGWDTLKDQRGWGIHHRPGPTSEDRQS